MTVEPAPKHLRSMRGGGGGGRPLEEGPEEGGQRRPEELGADQGPHILKLPSQTHNVEHPLIMALSLKHEDLLFLF